MGRVRGPRSAVRPPCQFGEVDIARCGLASFLGPRKSLETSWYDADLQKISQFVTPAVQNRASKSHISRRHCAIWASGVWQPCARPYSGVLRFPGVSYRCWRGNLENPVPKRPEIARKLAPAPLELAEAPRKTPKSAAKPPPTGPGVSDPGSAWSLYNLISVFLDCDVR